MEAYCEQPSHEMDWTMQQFPAYQTLALGNESLSRLYKRRVSKVTKPSSAGNSPHAMPRRRTMTTAGSNQYWTTPVNTEAYPATNLALLNASLQRKSRPTSWHPSSRHTGYNFYTPNCHPSWLDDDSTATWASQQQQQQQPQPNVFATTPVHSISAPITCPVSGDLISNDYFTAFNNYYDPSMTSAYPMVEPSDMCAESYGWPNPGMERVVPSATGWIGSLDGYVPTEPMADLCQESVTSSDASTTAPPTPDNKPCGAVIITSDENTTSQGDDLVAVGLYDEPEALSLESSLLGGSIDSHHPAGKGLKLEETFSPAPEAEDDNEEAEYEEEEIEEN